VDTKIKLMWSSPEATRRKVQGRTF